MNTSAPTLPYFGIFVPFCSKFVPFVSPITQPGSPVSHFPFLPCGNLPVQHSFPHSFSSLRTCTMSIICRLSFRVPTAHPVPFQKPVFPSSASVLVPMVLVILFAPFTHPVFFPCAFTALHCLILSSSRPSPIPHLLIVILVSS